jgi:hypothetical protein
MVPVGFDGDPHALAYVVMGIATLAIVVPLTIALIRLLNETWLDPDRRGEGQGPRQEEVAPAAKPMSRGTDQRVTPRRPGGHDGGAAGLAARGHKP